jgi:hypothetical protein
MLATYVNEIGGNFPPVNDAGGQFATIVNDGGRQRQQSDCLDTLYLTIR